MLELSQTTLETKTELTHLMPSAVSVFGAIKFGFLHVQVMALWHAVLSAPSHYRNCR